MAYSKIYIMYMRMTCMKVSDIENEKNKLFVLLRQLKIPPMEFKITFDCMKIAEQLIELDEKANKECFDLIKVSEEFMTIMEPYIK